MDQLEITKTTEGNVCVLHLAGRLDGQSEASLFARAQDEYVSGTRLLLIDLGKLEMLSSAGLRSLHNIYKMYTPKLEIDEWNAAHPDEPYKSKYFKLAGATPQIYYVLNIAGFLHNIPMFGDLKQGLDSFKS